MEFVDDAGNILVPKSIRPIVGLDETIFGSRRGAKKQYRYGNLHIREYDDHYTVHMDRISPLHDPFGHLLVDAPEYLVGAATAIIVGKQAGTAVYNKLKHEGKNDKDAAIDALITGYITGSSAGRLAFDTVNSLKKSGK